MVDRFWTEALGFRCPDFLTLLPLFSTPGFGVLWQRTRLTLQYQAIGWDRCKPQQDFSRFHSKQGCLFFSLLPGHRVAMALVGRRLEMGRAGGRVTVKAKEGKTQEIFAQ